MIGQIIKQEKRDTMGWNNGLSQCEVSDLIDSKIIKVKEDIKKEVIQDIKDGLEIAVYTDNYYDNKHQVKVVILYEGEKLADGYDTICLD